jgi:hypothetical protein
MAWSHPRACAHNHVTFQSGTARGPAEHRELKTDDCFSYPTALLVLRGADLEGLKYARGRTAEHHICACEKAP